MKLLLTRYFIKRREQVFPSFCIVLFVIFVGTDTYTTYLATPDLKLESNPVYQYFKWGWVGHLLYILSVVIITILLVLISNKYILQYLKNKKHNIPTNKFLFVIFFLLVVYCYHNLIATFECSINNYLVYRYLHLATDSEPQKIIEKIALGYVKFYLNFGEVFLAHIVTIIECLLAALITVFQIKRVKKYVQSLPFAPSL